MSLLGLVLLRRLLMSFSVIKLFTTIKDTFTVAIGCVSGQNE